MNMKILKNSFVLLMMVVAMSSCTKNLRPFTQNLYDDYRWTENDLKKIQFYLSDDIVMTRESNAGKSEIEGGEIKVVEGRTIEQVVIPKGTPGIFLFSPKSDRFAISFDDRSDELYLMFGPNPKAGDRYVLLASEWKRRGGKVTYGGKKWRVNYNGAWAGLLVDLKKIKKVQIKKSRAKGRTVN